jgi:hypothetical protein
LRDTLLFAIIMVEASMNLTAEQVESIKEGDPVRLTPDEVGTACVVLRADVYDRVKSLIDSDVEFRPRETYPAVLNALDAYDESPEQYLEYLHE